MKSVAWLLSLTLGAAGVARAEGAYPYSLYAGQTVGYNSNVFSARAGWPGVSVGILHGLTDVFDIGGTVAFNYGVEGMTDNPKPGIKGQLNLRYRLLDNGKFDLGLHFDPGFLTYFYGGFVGTHAGLTVPVGLSVGVPIASAFLLHFGFDIPLYFVFGDPGSYTGLPFLAGGGFEYFIDRQLSVNFTIRLGPTVAITSFVTNTFFTLYALFGVGYKF